MADRALDLVAVLIVAGVAVALALLGLDSGIALVVLGLPLTLLLPGYALTALFAPGTFSRAERWLLSIGLSLTLTVIGRVLLALTPWGLQISSWAVLLGGTTLIAATVALLRRPARSSRPSMHHSPWASQLMIGLLGGIAIGIVVTQISAPQSLSAAVTQFWLAPTPQPSPTAIALGEVLDIARPTPTTPAEATNTPVPPPAAITSPAPEQPTAAPADDPTANAPPAGEPIDIALADWPSRETDTAILRYEDDRYRLELTGQSSVGVSSVLPAENYRLGIDVAVEEGEAGVIFLAAPPTTFFRLMFDTDGRYAVQRLQQSSNAATPIVDWTEHPALVDSEQIRVRIERQIDTIRFFANDQALTSFTVPSDGVINQAGVALASASGRGRAEFTDLVVEQLTD